MPAAFLGHGTPMNAIDRNRYTEAWRAFGARVPRPRAILMISAHWYINASAVTAMEQPRTIHDFYGFPEELFAVEYPARGDPALAGEITELVKPTWVGQDRDSWGIDHGAWSVLVHAFPSADIPVVQLSANALKPFDYHLELGAKLAPLREQGVLVLASGNIVHNLGRMDWTQPDTGYPWVRSFDDSAREVMTADPAGCSRTASPPVLFSRGPDTGPLHSAALPCRARRQRRQGHRGPGGRVRHGFAVDDRIHPWLRKDCLRRSRGGARPAENPARRKQHLTPDRPGCAVADGAIAVPSQASFGGPATAEAVRAGQLASGMITHCQFMGQEPRIALTDPWLSLLFASADIVLPCTT